MIVKSVAGTERKGYKNYISCPDFVLLLLFSLVLRVGSFCVYEGSTPGIMKFIIVEEVFVFIDGREKLKNRGRTFMKMAQFHFHFPSLHLINCSRIVKQWGRAVVKGKSLMFISTLKSFIHSQRAI